MATDESFFEHIIGRALLKKIIFIILFFYFYFLKKQFFFFIYHFIPHPREPEKHDFFFLLRVT